MEASGERGGGCKKCDRCDGCDGCEGYRCDQCAMGVIFDDHECGGCAISMGVIGVRWYGERGGG
jgi:hypothetical protein